MNNWRIQIIDKSLKEQYVLHCRHQKYWQIRFEESQQKVFIECGPLLKNNQKDPNTILDMQKKVLSKPGAKKYMEDCINIKLTKGYKFLRPQKPTQEIKESPPISSTLGKRPNPNDQAIIVQARETSKKVHPSSTSSGLNPQMQGKSKATEPNVLIVIDDEDEDIEKIIDENSSFIGLNESKKRHWKRTENDGR